MAERLSALWPDVDAAREAERLAENLRIDLDDEGTAPTRSKSQRRPQKMKRTKRQAMPTAAAAA